MAIDLNAYKQKAKQIQQNKTLNTKQSSENNYFVSDKNSIIPNLELASKSNENSADKQKLSFASTFNKALQDYKRNQEISIDQLDEDLTNASTEQDIQKIENTFNKLCNAVIEKIRKQIKNPKETLQKLYEHPDYKHYKFALNFVKEFEDAKKQYMSEIENSDLKKLYAQINDRDSGINIEYKINEFKDKKDKFSQKINVLFQSLNEKENTPEEQKPYVNYKNIKNYFMKNYPEMAFVFDIIPENIMELNIAERGKILEDVYIEAAKRADEIGLGLSQSDKFLLDQLQTYADTKKDIDDYPNKKVRWRKDPTEDFRKGRKEEIPTISEEIERCKNSINNTKIKFRNQIKPILDDFYKKINQKKAEIKNNTSSVNFSQRS